MNTEVQGTRVLTVNLDDSLHEFVTGQVRQGGYGSADEYLRELLQDARAHEEEVHADPEALKTLLRQGLESGPSADFTPEDWADIRREVRARVDARQNG